MINFIAEAFKHMVGFIAGLALIASVIFGVAAWISTGGGWQAWLALVAGPLLVIFTFGTLALVIQNNQLLRRIADGQDAPPKPRAEPASDAALRREPAMRAGR
ncbi:hypothetical protein BV394_02110 [Brevirhabdus pacifica]|uniref:Uncharacterized protein n=1 Tax=Brevirhabdus pacifica TaxID=1267768 RepID=A0A1U7DFA0_9RHOB|nr:hypothetical protein [Brevirhabdus pacifica]APX88674.1 hypothetical protein BV394_02110 [Brevirhabdus pacifica]OWU79939.1 hypothetical protein ATO5_02790 [Loktanella sp. 22II-4b]PJJ86822.1 hypothetical protein CLV77_1380 [Brevirhabdus pacifica]